MTPLSSPNQLNPWENQQTNADKLYTSLATETPSPREIDQFKSQLNEIFGDLLLFNDVEGGEWQVEHADPNNPEKFAQAHAEGRVGKREIGENGKLRFCWGQAIAHKIAAAGEMPVRERRRDGIEHVHNNVEHRILNEHEARQIDVILKIVLLIQKLELYNAAKSEKPIKARSLHTCNASIAENSGKIQKLKESSIVFTPNYVKQAAKLELSLAIKAAIQELRNNVKEYNEKRKAIATERKIVAIEVGKQDLRLMAAKKSFLNPDKLNNVDYLKEKRILIIDNKKISVFETTLYKGHTLNKR